MFLVKSCPGCGQKIRFPLDRGVIRVNCPCGYSFKADPDDRALYIDATIDLAKDSEKSDISLTSAFNSVKSYFSSLMKRITSFRINLDGLKQKIIINFYNVKYWLQNYRLHPDSENRRIIIPLMFLLVLAAGILIFFILGR